MPSPDDFDELDPASLEPMGEVVEDADASAMEMAGDFEDAPVAVEKEEVTDQEVEAYLKEEKTTAEEVVEEEEEDELPLTPLSMYMVMLVLSFICICIACLMLYLELRSYGTMPYWKTEEGQVQAGFEALRNLL